VDYRAKAMLTISSQNGRETCASKPEGPEQVMNSRLVLGLAAFVAVLGTPALADPREDVLQAMNKCAAIAADHERLTCYDGLKPQLQAALAAPPPQQVAQKDDSSWFGLDHLFGGGQAPQTQPKQFGSERLPPTEQAKVNPPPANVPEIKEIDSITAVVTDYALTPTGRFIVFLDNDQVWQQIEGDTMKAHFKKNPKDNTVTISRAFLGSYALKLNDLNQIFKVKRVK
jgi:hypothetical protein